LLARTVQANPLGSTLAPVTEAITSAVCIDAWHNTRPCHSPVRLLNDRHYPAYMASRWWSDLISTAGEVATSPRFLLGGKRASCSAAFDGASLLKLDFLRFQLNMDIDLDVEEDRFDTVRLAYRSCWH
jgi:hypothetical protein